MKKIILMVSILALAAYAFAGYSTFDKIKLSDERNSLNTKKIVSPVGYVSATAVAVAPPFATLACVGLSGVAEAGSTEGYTTLDAGADRLLIMCQVPETWIDTGNATDIGVSLDCAATTSASTVYTTRNVDCTVYKYGSTDAIVASTRLTWAKTSARTWRLIGLNLGSAAISPGDMLILNFQLRNTSDDCNIYGIKLNFVPGIETGEAKPTS